MQKPKDYMKEIKKKISSIGEDIPDEDNVDSIIPESELQRPSRMKCPKCRKNTLEIDAANGRILCTNCGFREAFPGMR
ncbi:hypothetical protein J4206_00730 [Candidatus Woesearchaeota archaeon]|nr:hypothetical protein [Candidatus Woesearchaeota archaeon]